MKQKRSIAKMAVSAGLALAMAAGMAAPATVAFAATYGTGSIEILKKDNAYTQSFLGYQIFKANVQDDKTSTTGKKESNIAWASDSVKTAVENATERTFATAQDAADWIAQNVTGTSSTTAVDATSPAYKIAEAVKASGATATPLNAGEAKSLDEGYWVFVMNPDSKLSDKETGTAPIFAVVGGSVVKVTEKVSDDSIPTPGKEIVNQDSSNSKGGSVAVGDTTTYELSATIPANIASYKTYKLVFTDTLSDGLTYVGNVTGAQLVKADGKTTDLESVPKVAGNGQTHTFTYTDLKSVLPEDYKYAKGDKIVFRYDAKVNDKAKAGTDIYNQVVLEYSNDPSSTGTGKTVEQQTHQYTYKLVLNKVDLGTEAALPGATFTVANASDKPVNYNGQSYNKGAVLATVPTDSKGALTVEGLDAGTYTIKETAAPTGYTAAEDVTVTIAPTFNGDGTIATLGNNLTSRDDVIAGEADKTTTGDNVLQAKAETASDANAGTVTVTIGDRKQITMPLTGMKGTTALLVYGSAILVISAGAYLKHRKNQSEDDAQ